MKIKELLSLANDVLNAKVKDISEEYFKLKFQHGIRPLENTAKLKQLKKDIAKLKTVIAQRRINN